MRDYSQEGEQGAILASLPDAGVRHVLDVGAWHPTVFSNSRALIEAGWSAVLLEPHPVHAAHLQATYAEWADVEVLERALGLEAGLLPLWLTDDSMSTFDEPTRVKWADEAAYRDAPHMAMVTTWETLWAARGPFDVVSLDAEGWSVPLLRRMLYLGYRPAVVCCEYDHELTAICRTMRDSGYHLRLLNGTNAVWSIA